MVFEHNKTYFGDCLELMDMVPDKSVPMIFTDLPFGTTKCHWDSVINLPRLWSHYERIIKDNGVILLFAQTPFDKVLGASNLKLLRYEWIWEKTSATGHYNAKKMPMKAHENILVFYKNLPTYNPQMTHDHVRKVSKAEHKINCKESEVYNKSKKKTTYDSTDRYPRDVLKFPSDKQKSKLHSCQKPLALCKYMINTYSNPGDLVLDNCSGSGTIGLAAQELDRPYIMMENDENFFDVSKQRVHEN